MGAMCEHNGTTMHSNCCLIVVRRARSDHAVSHIKGGFTLRQESFYWFEPKIVSKKKRSVHEGAPNAHGKVD